MRVKFVDPNTTFEAAPEGVYTLVVDECVEKKFSSGNEGLAVTLKIVDNEQFKGRKVWANMVTGSDNPWMANQFLAACNIELSANDDGEVEFNPKECLGKKVQAHLTQGEYNGKPKNEVKAFIVSDPTSDTGKKSSGPKFK